MGGWGHEGTKNRPFFGGGEGGGGERTFLSIKRKISRFGFLESLSSYLYHLIPQCQQILPSLAARSTDITCVLTQKLVYWRLQINKRPRLRWKFRLLTFYKEIWLCALHA